MKLLTENNQTVITGRGLLLQTASANVSIIFPVLSHEPNMKLRWQNIKLLPTYSQELYYRCTGCLTGSMGRGGGKSAMCTYGIRRWAAMQWLVAFVFTLHGDVYDIVWCLVGNMGRGRGKSAMCTYGIRRWAAMQWLVAFVFTLHGDVYDIVWCLVGRIRLDLLWTTYYRYFSRQPHKVFTFLSRRCYRAFLYPSSLLNTQFADCIWMYVYRLQINWEI
jgi:glycosyltransferase involved in cell wall biosynthesis